MGMYVGTVTVGFLVGRFRLDGDPTYSPISPATPADPVQESGTRCHVCGTSPPLWWLVFPE